MRLRDRAVLRRQFGYIALFIFILEVQCSAQSTIKVGAVVERGIFAARRMVQVSIYKPGESVAKVGSTEFLAKDLSESIVITERSRDGHTLPGEHDLIHCDLAEIRQITGADAAGKQNEVWGLSSRYLRDRDAALYGAADGFLVWQIDALRGQLYFHIFRGNSARNSSHGSDYCRDAQGRFKLQDCTLSSNRFISHQRSLLLNLAKCLLRSNRSDMVSVVDPNGVGGIDAQDDKTEKFQATLRIVEYVSILLAGLMALAFGWWNFRFSDRRWAPLYGVALLYLGIPLTVWGIVVLTSLFGV